MSDHLVQSATDLEHECERRFDGFVERMKQHCDPSDSSPQLLAKGECFTVVRHGVRLTLSRLGNRVIYQTTDAQGHLDRGDVAGDSDIAAAVDRWLALGNTRAPR